MKRIICISIAVFFFACSRAQELPSKKGILKTITLANHYFMNKWPDPFKPIHVPSRNRTWPSNIWTRAVYYEGLMALYSVDQKKAYYDYAVDWGVKHKWNLREEVFAGFAQAVWLLGNV